MSYLNILHNFLVGCKIWHFSSIPGKLTVTEVKTAIFKVILATTKVILVTEEVLIATVNVISATTNVRDLRH